jgi:glucan phosphoethanolaminetransferase (alkaline phosphatase superfamily)
MDRKLMLTVVAFTTILAATILLSVETFKGVRDSRVIIVEELAAVGFAAATVALLFASIVIFLFGSLRSTRVLKALTACVGALFAMTLLATLKSWMGGGLVETWSKLARGAFYSALSSLTVLAGAAAGWWVERKLERVSPEAAKRFEKAFLIAFIVSAITAMIVTEILRGER